MDARHVLAGVMGSDHVGDDLVEMHRGGVLDQRPFGGGGDDFGGDQRAGIEADRTALDQPLAAHRDQIGRTGAGTNEIDGHRTCLASSKPLAQTQGPICQPAACGQSCPTTASRVPMLKTLGHIDAGATSPHGSRPAPGGHRG